MGFGGRVRIGVRGHETGVRRDAARRGRGGTTRARAHDALGRFCGRARRRGRARGRSPAGASRAKPKPQEKRAGEHSR